MSDSQSATPPRTTTLPAETRGERHRVCFSESGRGPGGSGPIRSRVTRCFFLPRAYFVSESGMLELRPTQCVRATLLQRDTWRRGRSGPSPVQKDPELDHTRANKSSRRCAMRCRFRGHEGGTVANALANEPRGSLVAVAGFVKKRGLGAPFPDAGGGGEASARAVRKHPPRAAGATSRSLDGTCRELIFMDWSISFTSSPPAVYPQKISCGQRYATGPTYHLNIHSLFQLT